MSLYSQHLNAPGVCVSFLLEELLPSPPVPAALPCSCMWGFAASSAALIWRPHLHIYPCWFRGQMLRDCLVCTGGWGSLQMSASRGQMLDICLSQTEHNRAEIGSLLLSPPLPGTFPGYALGRAVAEQFVCEWCLSWGEALDGMGRLHQGSWLVPESLCFSKWQPVIVFIRLIWWAASLP